MQLFRAAGARLTADLAVAIERIYLASFPESEREPFAEMWEEISHGGRHLWVAGSDAGVAGFAVRVPIPGACDAVLEYLAVDGTRRSEGIGGLLFDALVDDGRAGCGDRPGGLLFEVERPPAGAEALDARRRRIAFYERHGARIVRCAPAYAAPNMLSGEPPLEMRLMWVDFDSTAPPPSGERLRGLVRDLLTVSYELALDDEILHRNMEALEC